MRAGWRNLLLVSGLLAALAHAQVVNAPNVNLSEDTDQDGISNADEVALGLDPYNPYNGISALDGAAFIVAWERYLGASSSTVDTDGDGWSDFDEVMVYQTNLFDERSLPGPISNLSAATTSQPVAASTPTATPSTSLIQNGDFSKTNISTWIDGKKLKGYNGSGFEWAAGSVEGWSAYAGSTIEVWNTGTRVVELNGDKSNYGIQQKVETAKPGAYLLAWRSLGRTQEAAPAKNKKTPPAPDNFYFVQVQIGEGRGGSVIKKENFTAGGDGVLVFQLSENDLTAANGKGIYIAFIPTNGSNSYGSLISGVSLVPFSAHLAVDRDRDGVISPSSYQDMTTVGRPFRFWVNDDEDSGEAGDSGERDVDGTYGFRYVQGPRGGLERRRYLRSNSQSTGYVDGSRDLVDFFPVSLDIQQVLAVLPPDANTK
ncbi:MAG: hypothetical protein RIS76_2897 [Verrucomicrobiota bacterium]